MQTVFARSLIELPGDALPSPHENCYWLVPGRLLAGEHPCVWATQTGRDRLAALLDAGITHFVDLTGDREPLSPYADTLTELAAARGTQAVLLRHSIVDFGVPSPAGMRLTLDALDDALRVKGNVYLHCHGGIGRTGTVVGCLLVEQGCTAAQALDIIAAKWQVMAKRFAVPRSPETQAQRDFIARWGELHQGSAR
jgi:hypothetical protein